MKQEPLALKGLPSASFQQLKRQRRVTASANQPVRSVSQGAGGELDEGLADSRAGIVAEPILDATPPVLAGRGGYAPLASVWYGEEDAELVEALLSFYPRKKPRLILDATVNSGRFWRSSCRQVIGLDIDSKHRPVVNGDNTHMPFQSAVFDVVVYDPPHIPNQGRDKTKDFHERFGLGPRSPKEHNYSFTHTYPAFMAEAWRVLRPEGTLLCKIADYIHNHRYQWAHVELIQAAQQVGFIPCDCIVKVRKGPIIDPRWKLAHHSRRQHCYWIVFRKSDRCE